MGDIFLLKWWLLYQWWYLKSCICSIWYWLRVSVSCCPVSRTTGFSASSEPLGTSLPSLDKSGNGGKAHKRIFGTHLSIAYLVLISWQRAEGSHSFVNAVTTTDLFMQSCRILPYSKWSSYLTELSLSLFFLVQNRHNSQSTCLPCQCNPQ